MKPTAVAVERPRRLREGFISIFLNLALLTGGAFLFAGAFPNPIFSGGLPFLAWFAFIPVFIVASRSGAFGSILYGAFYGYAAYGLFNYWLHVFHPLAGIIVGLIYLTYFAVLFPLLRLAGKLFPRWGYVLQWALWIAYEYLRTQGFLGYAYGIAGYSQWSLPVLIQIASVLGVWGVSALVVFPSAYLAAALRGGFGAFAAFLRNHRAAPIVWGAALAFCLGFGVLSQVDYSASPVKRIALIQNNTDPWRDGLTAYRENFRTLKRSSDEALAQNPRPEMVVWSETAFVPRIYWHKTYRDDPESYELVKELLDYLAVQDVPFVIGNDDARKEVGESGDYERVDYNAVLLFEKGEEQKSYRKLHLVPFTEHFPYKNQLPFVYQALKDADTHFWKTGNEATVFDAAGVRFSTPICFEDTFGDLSARFARAGAQMIVNVTNDAWANSLSAQMQHGTMAVFRAVENRRSVVRATASGQTMAVDPNGKVLAMAKPFEENFLVAAVPVYDSTTTPYTRWGDLPVIVFGIIALLILLAGVVGAQLTIHRQRRTIKRRASES